MFTNTALFSIIPNEGFCLAHPKSFEYKDWWTEQRKRCIEGYSIGGTRITGDHYWYLNFWKIRGVNEKTGRKDFVPPRFLDMDYEFFHAVEVAKANGKNLCVVKRRQAGFSEKSAALIGKEFSLFQHSQSIIVAGDEKYSQATMRMTLRGLANLDNTEFYKRKTPNTVDYVQAKYAVNIEGQREYRGSMSEIYQFTAKNNPQVTIGKQPSFIYFEEGGKFPGLKDAYKYIQPALETNFRKTGFALIVGTGGDMEKGADELEEMFYSPEAWDMMPFEYEDEETGNKRVYGFFVPAWKFAEIDNDGNSLKDKSLERIFEKREKARKAKDSQNYVKEVTQFPLTPEEAFWRTGGNRFNVQLLNHRLAKIRQDLKLSNMMQRGNLEWDKDVNGKVIGVNWISDPNGDFRVLEHPEKDANGNVFHNLYKGSTDSYDKDEANTSTSKLSCQVFKGFLNAEKTSKLFVARYTKRPKTAEEAYEASAKLMVYYNCRNLIEYSNIGIFGWYERNNLTHLLKERPRVAYSNVKNSRVNNRYGIDPSTKEYWITAYRDYIEQNVENMFDEDQIIAAIKYTDETNCDITISSSLCVVHEIDEMDIKVKETTAKPTEFFFYKSKGGRFSQGFSKV